MKVNLDSYIVKSLPFLYLMPTPFKLQLAFDVYPVVNGAGVVKFAWQKSVGNYLAITGY